MEPSPEDVKVIKDLEERQRMIGQNIQDSITQMDDEEDVAKSIMKFLHSSRAIAKADYTTAKEIEGSRGVDISRSVEQNLREVSNTLIGLDADAAYTQLSGVATKVANVIDIFVNDIDKNDELGSQLFRERSDDIMRDIASQFDLPHSITNCSRTFGPGTLIDEVKSRNRGGEYRPIEVEEIRDKSCVVLERITED